MLRDVVASRRVHGDGQCDRGTHAGARDTACGGGDGRRERGTWRRTRRGVSALPPVPTSALVVTIEIDVAVAIATPTVPPDPPWAVELPVPPDVAAMVRSRAPVSVALSASHASVVSIVALSATDGPMPS